MKAIINGKIIMPDTVIESKALLFDDKILCIADPADAGGALVIDAGGKYVSPGLVDTHIHGYLGEDVSDGFAEGIIKIAEGIVKNGVTAWLPTTMTVPLTQLRHVFDIIRRLKAQCQRRGQWNGAEILGANMEGPYINPSKKGAQNEEYVIPASARFLKEYADIISIFTIAPEMPGAMECVEETARDTCMKISIGHTNATYDQAIKGFGAGISNVTHLFNAMTPLNHRDPGVVGAALASPDVNAEFIADTFHIHPGLFEMVAKIKGRKLTLITDCVRAGGLADGEYNLGGQAIYVKGIQCRLADGTIAGSVLRLNEAVRNMARHTRLPINEIVNMASLNPANAVGAKRKGSLETGKDADIIIADDDFQIEKTFIAGEIRYAKGENA